jgi:hypothetical protein
MAHEDSSLFDGELFTLEELEEKLIPLEEEEINFNEQEIDNLKTMGITENPYDKVFNEYNPLINRLKDGTRKSIGEIVHLVDESYTLLNLYKDITQKLFEDGIIDKTHFNRNMAFYQVKKSFLETIFFRVTNGQSIAKNENELGISFMPRKGKKATASASYSFNDEFTPNSSASASGPDFNPGTGYVFTGTMQNVNSEKVLKFNQYLQQVYNFISTKPGLFDFEKQELFLFNITNEYADVMNNLDAMPIWEALYPILLRNFPELWQALYPLLEDRGLIKGGKKRKSKKSKKRKSKKINSKKRRRRSMKR